MINELLLNVAIALTIVVGLILVCCLGIRLMKQLKSDFRKQAQRYVSMLVADVFVHTMHGAKDMDKIQSMVLLKKMIQKPRYQALILNELLYGLTLVDSEKEVFRTIYRHLGLTKWSLQKLQSKADEVKIEGVHELSQMSVTESVMSISVLTTSNNRSVRLRAYLALIKLSENPVTLFNNLSEGFTKWETEQIFWQLSNQSRAALFDFSVLLKSANASTVIFGIRIISAFKQWNHFIVVRALTTSQNVQIAREAQLALNALTIKSQKKHNEGYYQTALKTA